MDKFTQLSGFKKHINKNMFCKLITEFEFDGVTWELASFEDDSGFYICTDRGFDDIISIAKIGRTRYDVVRIKQ